ncbi:MAG: arginase [Planctomycetota bacterium]
MTDPTSAQSYRPIHVLGVPLDHGAGRRGVGMGPAAMRIAGLHNRLAVVPGASGLRDLGDLVVPAPETLPEGDRNARFLPLVTSVCKELAARVGTILRDGAFPLVLGGDHSIAIGTISGLAAHLAGQNPDATRPPRLGVLWFDAHGDINTPQTTPSGNIHGMPVACLLGNGPASLVNIGYDGAKLDPARVVQIGLRDVDEGEKALIRNSGIHAFTMSDIDMRGMGEVMREAIGFATRDVDMLHISFDIDSLDPREAPGTGTTVPGGLTWREAHLALEMVAETGKLTSFELVEVNPTLDHGNHTAGVAVDLIASALGKRIL